MERGRLEFCLGFMATMISGLVFMNMVAIGFLRFDFWYEQLITAIIFIASGGYTITGLVCWFTGISDYFFRD